MRRRALADSDSWSIEGFLSGAILGAGAMYFFDPQQGRRRRALVRDQINSAVIHGQHAAQTATRDFNNRVEGWSARATRLLSRKRIDSDDWTLAQHARARLGHLVSNPHTIRVSAEQGCLILEGPILAEDKPHLLVQLRMLPGVTDIDDRLEIHNDPAQVPGLRGGMTRQERLARSGQTWTPAMRGLATVGGGMLGLLGLLRRGPGATLLSIAGVALASRALADAGFAPHAAAEMRERAPASDSPMQQPGAASAMTQGTGVAAAQTGRQAASDQLLH